MANETHKEEVAKQSETAEAGFFKHEWPLLVILILPFILIAYYWDSIPAQIPMHWNFKGEADKWGGRNTVLIAPLINIGVALLLYFIPKIDPRKMNYPLFQRAFRMIRLTLAAFLLAVFLLTAAPAIGVQANPNAFFFVAIPLLLLVMGNFMRSVRSNFFVGVRTPWTLSSTVVWEKTHKFTAWLWTSGSLFIIIFRLICGNWDGFIYIFMTYIGILVIVPIVMSYIYYRQETKQAKLI